MKQAQDTGARGRRSVRIPQAAAPRDPGESQWVSAAATEGQRLASSTDVRKGQGEGRSRPGRGRSSSDGQFQSGQTEVS